MIKKIKSITLVLENCETVEIPTKALKFMSLENISESLWKINDNDIMKVKVVQELSIALDPTDLKSNIFGEDSTCAAERLTAWADITGISINYNDESEEKYFVSWADSDNAMENVHQKSKINENGELFIWIGKNIDPTLSIGYFQYGLNEKTKK